MTILSPNRFRRVSRLVKGALYTALGTALVVSLSACKRETTPEPMKLGADSQEETNLPSRRSTESVIVRTAIGSIIWRKLSTGEKAEGNVSTHTKSTNGWATYRLAKANDQAVKTDEYQVTNTPVPGKQGPLEWQKGTYVHSNEAPGNSVATDASSTSREVASVASPEAVAPPPEEEPVAPVRVLTTEEKIGVVMMELLQNPGQITGLDKKTRQELIEFYVGRNNYPVWVSGEGVGIRALHVIEEIRKADNYGLNSRNFTLPDPKMAGGTDAESIERLAKAEIALSLAAVKYVRQAKGGRLNPRKLSPSLDVRGKVLDANLVLDGLTKSKNPDRFLRSYHPKHPQFEALRAKYIAVSRTGRDPSTAQRLLINMEKWRWMPNNLGNFYIWLNIPEFEVRVVKNGEVIHAERAVVGKETNKTPVFSDRMEYIVFNPYWNVPNSIKVQEILPSLRRSTRIMDRHNLKVKYNGQMVDPSQVDWDRADVRRFEFYQPPGDHNVLGFVKFMFPNRHAVYMHDTTSKKLFDQDVRMFSHGCMRIRDPRRLAEIILSEDKGWPADQVDYLIRQGVDHKVQLSKKIPVHITYFTAWVERDGQLTSYRDYYGHDRVIATALTGQLDLTPIAEASTKVKVADTDETSRRQYGVPSYRATSTSTSQQRVYRKKRKFRPPVSSQFWSPN